MTSSVRLTTEFTKSSPSSLLDMAQDEVKWMRQANCIGTDGDAFFPDKGGSSDEARRICKECPVAVECLEYAQRHRIIDGIWGGYGFAERREQRKRARKAQR